MMWMVMATAAVQVLDGGGAAICERRAVTKLWRLMRDLRCQVQHAHSSRPTAPSCSHKHLTRAKKYIKCSERQQKQSHNHRQRNSRHLPTSAVPAPACRRRPSLQQ